MFVCVICVLQRFYIVMHHTHIDIHIIVWHRLVAVFEGVTVIENNWLVWCDICFDNGINQPEGFLNVGI